MELYEYDSLCDRFGENQVKCKNCRNFNPVEFQNNPSGSIGFCAAQCFEIDAANGTSPIILLNSRSNCYTPDAVKQDFWPTQDLLDAEDRRRPSPRSRGLVAAMCRHATECPDATQLCAGALFCPLIEDIEYSYVGPMTAHEDDHGRQDDATGSGYAGIQFYE